MDKEIGKKANTIVMEQEEKVKEDENVTYTSAGKSKICYLAGACVHKIMQRLKESVLRKVGKPGAKTKVLRDLHYKKQKLLSIFRIKEDKLDLNDESMLEIESKQNSRHGLTIVSDNVLSFFIQLNNLLQKCLMPERFHLNPEDLHKFCQHKVDSDENLIEFWISLFKDIRDESVSDEIFLTLFMELFRDVSEHFIRIAFVDALKNFKRSVPRKKKQALRTKIQALGERDGSSSKNRKLDEEAEQDIYTCSKCQKECEWEPKDKKYESVACDKCNCWFHYHCENLKGTESFLTKDGANWYCSNCSKKGKGKGKSSTSKGKTKKTK